MLKTKVCLKTSYFMRHRILECLKQNDSQFIVNKNNKGQLDETFLPENSQKVKILSHLEKQEKAEKSQNI